MIGIMNDEEFGSVKRAAIYSYDLSKGVMLVKFANTLSIKGNTSKTFNVPIPLTFFDNNKKFIGSLPAIGTPIVVSMGEGGQYYFVSFLAENLSKLPSKISSDNLLIQYNDSTYITLSNSEINIGNSDDFSSNLYLNTKRKIITTNFDNQNSFSKASRNVNGIIKRELNYNKNINDDLRLNSDINDDNLYKVGLDPTLTVNTVVAGQNKNPAFVENRKVVYEFDPESEVLDEYTEYQSYSKDGNISSNDYVFPNRRKNRNDLLSLTVLRPNFLIEKIEGTVVDIFGNIIDINRSVLPIGKQDFTLRSDDNSNFDAQSSYQKIKELLRRSIAYHFELNVKKDLIQNGNVVLPDINSNSDYSKNRSRFQFDIDKEGQFKLNIPASSEKGNIPLLVRNENYSSFGNEDNSNPDKFIVRKDNIDLFQDSFAAPEATMNNDGWSYSDYRGSITVVDNDVENPIKDRITKKQIRHGTAYHDIRKVCYAHQTSDFLLYPNELGTDNFKIDVNEIPLLKDVVSSKIITSGSKANAGGRSGLINLDGSLEVNIGANTVDRQSLIMDMAGGFVAAIGRDTKNMSGAISLDGNLFLQIGGMGVSTDSRFKTYMNGHIGGVFDIRVMNSGGRAALLRFDDNGLSIMNPGNIQIHSGQNLRMTADSNIEIEAENVTIQKRVFMKEVGGSV